MSIIVLLKLRVMMNFKLFIFALAVRRRLIMKVMVSIIVNLTVIYFKFLGYFFILNRHDLNLLLLLLLALLLLLLLLFLRKINFII